MSGNAARVFQDAPAVRTRCPLIIGITGASSSGKTYSALRLATGIQRVLGGEIYGIDTESKRMLHYADYFQFRHVPFDAPHGPLDYVDVINHCASKGARIIVIDNMSHEHEGEGGVLDQIDKFLEAKAGNDWEKRNQFLMVAQVKPKRERKELNRRIVQLGDIVFILLYRADEKIKPLKKGEKNADGSREPKDLGWQPTTTSKLPYDMTVRFLLTPASEGVPSLIPPKPEEKKLVKQPRQFKDWFKEGEALSEDMGERLANWSMGKVPAPKAGAPTVADYEACRDQSALDALEQRRSATWASMPGAQKAALRKAADAAKARLSPPTTTGRQPYTVDTAITALRASQDDSARASVWADIERDFKDGVPSEVVDVNLEMQDALTRM